MLDQNVKVVNENHTWSSGQNHTPYANSKYNAELEIWRASKEGIDVVIINPGLILGAYFWEPIGVPSRTYFQEPGACFVIASPSFTTTPRIKKGQVPFHS